MRISDTLLILMAIVATSLGLMILWQEILAPLEIQLKLLILIGLLVVITIVIWLQDVHQPSKRSVARIGQNHAAAASTQTGTNRGLTMANLNRYFAWIEKKLNDLMVREQLECGLVKLRRGPLVITMQLRLIHPTQRDLQKLLKLGPAMAQSLQVESVRLTDSAQGILVEILSPQPLTPNGSLLARHARRLNVPVGVNAFARPVMVNLEDHGALFWVGPSRRGKTQSMKSVLYALLRNNNGRVHFVIIASPAKVNKDWGIFRTVYGCLGIVSTNEEIDRATGWMVEQMNVGAHLDQGIHILLVVDDLPNILKAVPSITPQLAEIAGMGAGLGIHLLVGTQGAGSKQTSGGTQIENNVTARVLYRPSTARSGSQNAGMSGLSLAHLTAHKGDSIALIDGQSTRIASAWILDREIALLYQQDAPAAPWQQEQSNESANLDPSDGVNGTSQNNLQNSLEQPRTGQNSPKTGQNNPEQGRTTPLHGQIGRNGDQNGVTPHAESEQPSEQFSEQATEQAMEVRVHELARCTINELKNENLGLNAATPPTEHDAELIRLAYEITQSVRKTCFIAYGHYNGKVRDFVKAALADRAQSSTEAIPDEIDLTTVNGQHTLDRLQQNGVINWPDVDDLLTTE